MIFKKLKQKSLKKKLEAHLSMRETGKVESKIRTVGFLVNETQDPNFEKYYEIFKDLSLQPKDVKVFSFVESKKKLPSLRQNQVQHKDYDWKGNLHNQNAQEFLEKEFDVLIGYYSKPHEILDVMVATSKATFKVGVLGADTRLYDLLLDVPISDFTLFKSELKKYLHVFRKL